MVMPKNSDIRFFDSSFPTKKAGLPEEPRPMHNKRKVYKVSLNTVILPA